MLKCLYVTKYGKVSQKFYINPIFRGSLHEKMGKIKSNITVPFAIPDL